MILTIDGVDFAGKTTLADILQDRYGFLRAPKVISMGIIPADLNQRLKWYETAPSEEITKSILESDIKRREVIKGKNAVVERGRITIVSNCIAKTAVREKCSYVDAENLTYAIAKELRYSPDEDLILYLRALENNLPLLEKRKHQREGCDFSAHELEYYPILLEALEAESKKSNNVEEINSFQSMEDIISEVDVKLKWNQ